MKRLIKITVIGLALFILTSTAFGAGIALGGSGYLFEPRVAQAAGQPAEFEIFWQAWGLVHRHFVDQDALDTTELTYGAIRGMIVRPSGGSQRRGRRAQDRPVRRLGRTGR